MKILVRNLARNTTEEELKSFFTVFGKVQSCDLVLDKATGKSKGFAFVEMPKVGEAKVAIKKLNNKAVAGNLIRVKKAETKVESKGEKGVEDKADTKNEAKPEVKAVVKDQEQADSESNENKPKKFSWEKKKLI